MKTSDKLSEHPGMKTQLIFLLVVENLTQRFVSIICLMYAE